MADTPETKDQSALGVKVLLALLCLAGIMALLFPHYIAFSVRVIADAEHYRQVVLHRCAPHAEVR